MSFFNKQYQSSDFKANKRMLQEEGTFNLNFAGVNFVPSETRQNDDGSEYTTAERIEVDFVTTDGAYATVRYNGYRFNQVKNLFEYMIDNEYVKGLPDDFTLEMWEEMTYETKAKFMNGLQKSKLKHITVVSEEETAASGRTYFAYDINQETKEAIETQQAQQMVEPPLQEEPVDEEFPF